MGRCLLENGCLFETCLAICRVRFPPTHFVPLVSDLDIANPDFIRDLREFTARFGLKASEWRKTLVELYSRFDGLIIDATWRRIYLSFEPLEATEHEIFEGNGALAESRIQDWFEDTLCKPCPDGVTPYVRCEARERFRVVGTILRAAYPHESMMWGVRAANDNSPPIPPGDPEPRA